MRSMQNMSRAVAVLVAVCAAVTAFASMRAGAQTEPTQSACWKSVQGKIKYNDASGTAWPADALQRLCGSATSSTEPGKCYQRLMSGGVSWGGGTSWAPDNAIRLCAGTRDANARISCFEAQIAKKVAWDKAINACTAPTSASAPPPTVSSGPTGRTETLPTPTPVKRDKDGDGYDSVEVGGQDCDDDDALRHPGRAEVTDVRGDDEDCNPETIGTLDQDGDGFVSDRSCNGALCGPDCNDQQPAINPRSQELPNRLDDDCNGATDDLLGNWYSPNPQSR